MELSRLCRFICMFIILRLSLKMWKMARCCAGRGTLEPRVVR
jgi:hypothetical protein